MARKTKPQVQEVEQAVEVQEVKVAKPRLGIGKVVKDMIIANPEMKNAEILVSIKESFPTANTSYACIAWYRTKVRQEQKVGV